MNECDKIQELWDEARDGGPACSAATELQNHLRACGDCQRLWEAESRWLGVLESERHAAPRGDARLLAEKFWTLRQRRSPYLVLARLGRWAMAAAAVLVVGLGLIWRVADRASEGQAGGTASVGSAAPVVEAAHPDPLGALLADAGDRIEGRTTQFSRMWTDTVAFFGPEAWKDLIEDPAQAP